MGHRSVEIQENCRYRHPLMMKSRKRCSIWCVALVAFVVSCGSVCTADESAAGRIVLVQGTLSAPNEAERNYAKTVAVNLHRWLDQICVPHLAVSDEQVGASLLKPAKVVILGYHASIPSSELWALRQFVNGGGKVLVFYSSDVNLAELMGVKMGQYMRTASPGRWTGIRFGSERPTGVPEVVLQESRNIRTVLPATRAGGVLGWWEDSQGRRNDPAVVKTPSGYWVTHVLLDEGDLSAKQQMLLGLLASCDPELWKTVAVRQKETAETLGKWVSYESAVKGIQGTPEGKSRDVQRLLREASATREDISSAMEAGLYWKAVEEIGGLRRKMTEAYASAQLAANGELRAVWEETGVGLFPGDWKKTCRLLTEAGFTDILVNMQKVGVGHYESRIVTRSDIAAAYGDQLKACVEAGKKEGIRVHAWKMCWNLDGASSAFVAKVRKEGRLQMRDDGRPQLWLCPSVKANRELEIAATGEIAALQPVSGVHLDFVRFADSHVCFCPVCRSSFMRDTGSDRVDWPADVRYGGKLWKAFSRWRAGQMSAFVRDASAAVKAARPGVAVSAAVFGRYPMCAESVGQNWGEWLRNGYLDFVFPMDYTSDHAKFGDLVRTQMALTEAGRIYPGLGVTALESRLGPVETIDQIVLIRREGARGFALFDLNYRTANEILPMLAKGLTKR